MQMNSRQRVLAALRHEQPDRVPTSLFWAELLHPDGRSIDLSKARDLLFADVRVVHAEPTVAGRQFESYLESLPDDVFVGDLAQLRRYHAWGYRPERSPHGPEKPSPLRHAASIDDVEAFAFPDFGGDAAFEHLRRDVQAHQRRGLPVFAVPPRLGGVIFEAAWRLRGFDAFMCDLADGSAVSMWLVDRLTDLVCHHARMIAAADADVLYFGDDFGEPTRLLVSPDMWQRVFAPRYRRVVTAARAVKPDIHVCFHSDGNFTGLLEHLAAIGVDAVEPVQPDCMDPAWIKQRFGRQLTLVGCAGTAWLFHHGTDEQVRAEVRRRIDQLADGGGLILAPAYDLMSCTSWENVAAFFDEVQRYTG